MSTPTPTACTPASSAWWATPLITICTEVVLQPVPGVVAAGVAAANEQAAVGADGQPDTAGTTPNTAKGYEVRALSNTVYYTVYKGIGTDTTVGTGLNNVVVRSYTGYNNVPRSTATSSISPLPRIMVTFSMPTLLVTSEKSGMKTCSLSRRDCW